MHDSVKAFLTGNIKPDEIAGKRIMEIGSLNINGSPRDVIIPLGPAVYLGLDTQSGPGVDIQMSADYLYTMFEAESFDFVVSTEMLEHAENWRQTIAQMKRVLRPGGMTIITCRAPGYKRHEQPADHWRFTTDDFMAIFADMNMRALTSDPDLPGVFAKYQKPAPVDLFAINPQSAPKE